MVKRKKTKVKRKAPVVKAFAKSKKKAAGKRVKVKAGKRVKVKAGKIAKTKTRKHRLPDLVSGKHRLPDLVSGKFIAVRGDEVFDGIAFADPTNVDAQFFASKEEAKAAVTRGDPLVDDLGITAAEHAYDIIPAKKLFTNSYEIDGDEGLVVDIELIKQDAAVSFKAAISAERKRIVDKIKGYKADLRELEKDIKAQKRVILKGEKGLIDFVKWAKSYGR